MMGSMQGIQRRHLLPQKRKRNRSRVKMTCQKKFLTQVIALCCLGHGWYHRKERARAHRIPITSMSRLPFLFNACDAIKLVSGMFILRIAIGKPSARTFHTQLPILPCRCCIDDGISPD